MPPFARLREFCAFWTDHRGAACCQLADAETVETDPEQFDCDTCAVRAAVDALDDANAEAWAVFHRVYTRFIVDWHLVTERLRLETAGWSPQAVLDLFDRLAIIYDELAPRREVS